MFTTTGLFAPVTLPRPIWKDRLKAPAVIDLDPSEWVVLPPAYIAADAMKGGAE